MAKSLILAQGPQPHWASWIWALRVAVKHFQSLGTGLRKQGEYQNETLSLDENTAYHCQLVLLIVGPVVEGELAHTY